MVETLSSSTPEVSPSGLSEGSVPSGDRLSDLAKGARASRNKYPAIPWLTESWLTKVVAYERIATASPRLDTVVVDEVAIANHVSSLPNLESPADLVRVVNQNGEPAGYRMKVRTWPLLQHDMQKVKEFAA